MTTQMKASEQYFPEGLIIIFYEVVLAIESVDEILNSDCSNESCALVWY